MWDEVRENAGLEEWMVFRKRRAGGPACLYWGLMQMLVYTLAAAANLGEG